MLARIDIPMIVNPLLLQCMQITTSGPGNINNFLWHEELNSWFIVKTIDEVIFESTKSRHELQRNLLVLSVETLSGFALKFSTEIFAPHGLFPPWTGYKMN